MKHVIPLVLLSFLGLSSIHAQTTRRTTRPGDIISTDSVSVPLSGKRPYLTKLGGGGVVRFITSEGVRQSAAEALNLTALTGGAGSSTVVATTFGQISGSLPANRVSGLGRVATSDDFRDLVFVPTSFPSSVSQVAGSWPGNRLVNLNLVNLSAFNNDSQFQRLTDVTTLIQQGTAGFVTLTTFNATQNAVQTSISTAQQTANGAATTANSATAVNVTQANSLTALDANKVDKIAGKGLSTVDFTTALRDKLVTFDAANLTGTVSVSRFPASGVVAGTYGSGTAVPVITFDATGRAVGATTTPITGGSSSGTVPPHEHQITQIIGFAQGVNDQMNAWHRAQDGWTDGQAQTFTKRANGTYLWITGTVSTTTTGGSSTTTTTPGGSAGTNLTPYDSVYARIDTTKNRINVALMTVDSVRNAAELRSRITSTQTNKDIVLTANFVDDDGEYVATGSFDNVRVRGVIRNGRKVVLKRTSYSTKWIWNNGNLRRRVELADLEFRTDYAGGTVAAPANAILWSTELVPWEGYKLNNVTVKGKANGGVYNGLNFQQASGVSGGGALAKDIHFTNVLVDSIPRSNEMLCQVYNVDRVSNFAVTYSKFSNTGLVAGAFGSNFSVSGRFAGMFFYRNLFDEGDGPQAEFVNASNVITMQNRITSKTRNGVGIGMSDDGRLLTKNVFHIDNYVNVSSRPFYDHGTVGTTIRGGLYIGREGVEIKAKNALYENAEIRVYDKTSIGVAFIDDPSSTGNTYRRLKITSQNARLYGAVTTKEPMILKGSNHTVTSVTTVIGQQTNGTYYASGAILDQGSNNVITTPTSYTAADTAAYVPPAVVAGTSDPNVVLQIDGNNLPNGATVIPDRSTYNHATISRGTVKVTTAVKKFGTGSLDFNGTSDFLEIAHSAQLNFGTADFTMEFWVRPTALATGTIAGLLSRSTTDNRIIWTTGWTNSSTVALSIKNASGGDLPSGPTSSAQSYGLNVWHHITFARVGGITRVYKGGQFIGVAADNPSMEASGNPGNLTFGARNIGGCCLFQGQAHFRVYKSNHYNIVGNGNFTPDESF